MNLRYLYSLSAILFLFSAILVPLVSHAAGKAVTSAQLNVESVVQLKTNNLIVVPVSLTVLSDTHLNGFKISLLRSVPVLKNTELASYQQLVRQQAKEHTIIQSIPNLLSEYDFSTVQIYKKDISANTTLTTDLSFTTPTNLPPSEYRTQIEAFDLSNTIISLGETTQTTHLGKNPAIHLDAGSMFLRSSTGVISLADPNYTADYAKDLAINVNVCSTLTSNINVFPEISFNTHTSSVDTNKQVIKVPSINLLANSCTPLNIPLPSPNSGIVEGSLQLFSSSNSPLTGDQPFSLSVQDSPVVAHQLTQTTHKMRYLLGFTIVIALFLITLLLLRLGKRSAFVILATGVASCIFIPHAFASSYSVSGFPQYERPSSTVYLQGATDGVLVVNVVNNEQYGGSNASKCGKTINGVRWSCDGPYKFTDFKVQKSSANFIPCSSSVTYSKISGYSAESSVSTDTVNSATDQDKTSPYGFVSQAGKTTYLVTCFSSGSPVIQADLYVGAGTNTVWSSGICTKTHPITQMCDGDSDEYIAKSFGPFTYSVNPGIDPTPPPPSLTVTPIPSAVDQNQPSTLLMPAQNANYINLVDSNGISTTISNASSTSTFTLTTTSLPSLPNVAGAYFYTAQACVNANTCSAKITTQVTRNASSSVLPSITPENIASVYLGDDIPVRWSTSYADKTQISFDKGAAKDFNNTQTSLDPVMTAVSSDTYIGGQTLVGEHSAKFSACTTSPDVCSAQKEQLFWVYNTPILSMTGPPNDPTEGSSYSVMITYKYATELDITEDGTVILHKTLNSPWSGSYPYQVSSSATTVGNHVFTATPVGRLVGKTFSPTTVSVNVIPNSVTSALISRFCSGD